MKKHDAHRMHTEKHVQFSEGLLKLQASKRSFLSQQQATTAVTTAALMHLDEASRNELRKRRTKKQKFNMLILLPASSPVRKG